jgi:hypothetical protein
MYRARAERVAMIALLVATVVLPPSPHLRAARSHVSLWPRCLEPRIAAGDVFPVDRGLALAVTRGIASHRPAVAPLVAAVSDYEATHPLASEDTFVGDERDTGDPLWFTLTVVELAERPELARPELMTELVQAGAGRDPSLAYGGMAGVNEFLVKEAYPSDGPGQNWDLFGLLEGQAAYLIDTGIVGSDAWRKGAGSARGVFGCDDDRESR